MVNVSGSRLVLNLKEYAAARIGDTDLDWDEPLRTPSQEAVLPIPYFTTAHARSGDEESSENFSSDLEMYSIERQCQQLGTRIH